MADYKEYIEVYKLFKEGEESFWSLKSAVFQWNFYFVI
jgi:hypothetical protein